MIAPARLAAYEVLRAVNSGRSDLPAALARVRARLDDERDRALAGEIATGTLRWQGAFDAVIAEFTRRPVDKLDRETARRVSALVVERARTAAIVMTTHLAEEIASQAAQVLRVEGGRVAAA